jgi:hypothetical protein
MITFKQFLSESRTSIISVDEFTSWADKNAKGYLSGEHFLYRGGSGVGNKGIMFGSSVGDRPRESANTYNNYTLWLDNNPMFKKWPKRSRSWIATDDWDDAETFGSPSLLVVADNASIGVVGEADLWHTEMPGIEWSLEDLNEYTQSLIKTKSKTYEELITAMKGVSVDDIDNDTINHFMKSKKLNDLFDLWDMVLNPHVFTGSTTGADVSHTAANGEVWIEGVCGFIPFIKRLSNEDAEKLTAWAEKYPNLLDEIHQHWSKIPYGDGDD